MKLEHYFPVEYCPYSSILTNKFIRNNQQKFKNLKMSITATRGKERQFSITEPSEWQNMCRR